VVGAGFVPGLGVADLLICCSFTASNMVPLDTENNEISEQDYDIAHTCFDVSLAH
jgi:hypothetical protein